MRYRIRPCSRSLPSVCFRSLSGHLRIFCSWLSRSSSLSRLLSCRIREPVSSRSSEEPMQERHKSGPESLPFRALPGLHGIVPVISDGVEDRSLLLDHERSCIGPCIHRRLFHHICPLQIGDLVEALSVGHHPHVLFFTHLIFLLVYWH